MAQHSKTWSMSFVLIPKTDPSADNLRPTSFYGTEFCVFAKNLKLGPIEGAVGPISLRNVEIYTFAV